MLNASRGQRTRAVTDTPPRLPRPSAMSIDGRRTTPAATANGNGAAIIAADSAALQVSAAADITYNVDHSMYIYTRLVWRGVFVLR